MKEDSPELERFRALVVDLNVQWQMFDDLFSDARNYEVFNRTGPNFWIHFQGYLLDAIFLSISRFFDPPESFGQANLSLARILELPEVTSIRCDLESRLQTMRQIWQKGIKIWRDKKLSHSDRPTLLDPPSLPDIPHVEVRQLVTGISEFCREIDHRLNHVDVGYHIGLRGWTSQVLSYLKLGIEKKDEKLARLRPSRSDSSENDPAEMDI